MTLPQRIDTRDLMTPGRAVGHEMWTAVGWYDGADMGRLLTDRMSTGGRTMISFSAHGVTEVDTRDLVMTAHRVAGGLHRLGLRCGDRVVVQLTEPLDRWVATVALAVSGLVQVPVPAGSGAADIDAIATDCAARGALVGTTWRNRPVSGLGIASRVGSVEHCAVAGGGASGDEIDWGQLVATVGSSPFVSNDPVRPADLFVILYTSGSTGTPKAVCHSHATFFAEMQLGHDTGGIDGLPGCKLTPYPGGHLSALTGDLRGLLWNERTVVLREWNGAHAHEAVSRFGVDFMNGSPLFLRDLIRRRTEDDASVRSRLWFRAGAASIPAQLVDDAEGAGVTAFRCYGSSEHPTVTTGSASFPARVRRAHDGFATPGAAVRTVGADGRPVPAGDVGEVETVGPDLFVGYLDQERTREAFTGDGWYRTGDDGRLDAVGLLQISGRRTEIVNRGGEKISPAELEAVLERLEGVGEAVVVSVPDNVYGQRAFAYLTPRGAQWNRTEPTLEDVRRHFAEQGVSKVKTPEYLAVRPELPRLHNGKIDRVQLRRLAAAEVEGGDD